MQNLPLEEGLVLSTFYVLALVKLRQYVAASEVVEAFGDFSSPGFQQKTEHGPVTLVPFGMRWLAAELPYRLGRLTAAQDALYRLAQLCQDEAEVAERREASVVQSAAESAEPRAEPEDEEGPALGRTESLLGFINTPAATWWRRYEAVGLAIMNHHLHARQHVPALQVLRTIERRRRADPRLFSMVGYVQMMIGDLISAEATFAAVARQGTPEAEILTRRNRSLILFARRKYSEAQEELETHVKQSPADSIAVNNRSICQMYCCELAGGILDLESAIKTRPTDNLSEPLLLNLTLMYELSMAGAAAEAKRRASQWDYYPEHLGAMIIINAPKMFTTVWNIIKPWLDYQTTSKIQILSKDFKEALLEAIPEENVPVYYGGKSTVPAGQSFGPWMDEKFSSGANRGL